MDPRSRPTRLVDDPAGALDLLAERGRTEFPHLAAARDYSRRRIAELREELRDADDERASVVLFGSWARDELTEHSDDDWGLLLGDELAEGDERTTELVERCRTVLGKDDKKPGSQDVFGVPFPCRPLIDHIGLEEDSNRNMTRRMLLLLESRALGGPVHAACWEGVLTEYLRRGVKDHRPPRFLLSDVIRYWRTIAVDFEGKHRETGGDDPKWVSRNAKLRTSRKVLFAGGLLPVLLCHLREAREMRPFLERQFKAVPTDRLAAAFVEQDAVPEGVRALRAYDRWIAIQQDPEARDHLAELREATRDASPLFQEIRALGKELEGGLMALLYETPLGPLTRRYALF